jgi:4-amino-4-deoxy-L-arabinose transferase-like glycosyltransferase
MTESVRRLGPVVIATAVAIGIVTGLRLWLSSVLGLAPDEAYYYQWSTDLALTYPDHPPLVAWLVRGGTAIAGESALGVRLLFVFCGVAAAWLAYSIARALELEHVPSALAALLAALLPVPAAATILATVDTPLGLCWLLAALALTRLAGSGPASSWYLLGASLGLGLLAKHTALLIVPATMLAAVLSPRVRRGLLTPHPWLGLALGLAIAAPYLVAEMRAGFPSVALQLAHLGGALPAAAEADIGSVPLRLAEVVGGQLGLLTPLVAVFALIGCARVKRLRPSSRICVAFFALPILATLIAALFVHPEQSWAALGHPLAALLAVGVAAGKEDAASGTRARVWLAAILISAFAITALIHVHAARPFLPLPPERDPVSRLHGWEGLQQLADRAEAVDAVVCDNYGLAAELAWHAPEPLRSRPIVGADRSPLPGPGRWLLLDEIGDWAGAVLPTGCSRIEPAGRLELSRADGTRIRAIDISIGSGCSGAESAPTAAR